MTVVDIETPRGLARAHLDPVDDPRGALVLGHGAGGSIGAPDLVAVAAAAREAGASVALVEQPYKVAGRRSAAPAAQLDEAWIAVVERLRIRALAGLRVVTGGRSSGARVACRTAEATGAAGVLCLAFPLQPPARRGSAGPPESRQSELDAVRVPVLVVQGRGDRFGMPRSSATRAVVEVDGDHGLRRDLDSVAAATADWLRGLLG